MLSPVSFRTSRFNARYQRFISFYLSSRQRPKLLASGMANKQERAMVILNPCHHGDFLLWIKSCAFFWHPSVALNDDGWAAAMR
jgi:hypothetical protein